MLLFDAKPPADATRPGGNALTFDWDLLKGADFRVPWLLAGGLTPENVADAIRSTGAVMVDVSSGVEETPGHKSAEKIRAFIKAAHSA
jgi:phosphoribosylanthranilate isomerase